MHYRIKAQFDGKWQFMGKFENRADAIEFFNELVALDTMRVMLICSDGYIHKQYPRKDNTRPIFQLSAERFTH